MRKKTRNASRWPVLCACAFALASAVISAGADTPAAAATKDQKKSDSDSAPPVGATDGSGGIDQSNPALFPSGPAGTSEAGQAAGQSPGILSRGFPPLVEPTPSPSSPSSSSSGAISP